MLGWLRNLGRNEWEKGAWDGRRERGGEGKRRCCMMFVERGRREACDMEPVHL